MASESDDGGSDDGGSKVGLVNDKRTFILAENSGCFYISSNINKTKIIMYYYT